MNKKSIDKCISDQYNAENICENPMNCNSFFTASKQLFDLYHQNKTINNQEFESLYKIQQENVNNSMQNQLDSTNIKKQILDSNINDEYNNLVKEINTISDQIKQKIQTGSNDDEISIFFNQRKQKIHQLIRIEQKYYHSNPTIQNTNKMIQSSFLQCKNFNLEIDKTELRSPKLKIICQNESNYSKTHYQINKSSSFATNDDEYDSLKSIDTKRYEEMNRINKIIFHNDEFRGKQAISINYALEKKDIFILMPTGLGKSLCYQLPGFMQGGLTIIVSPLISLIEDQVRKIKEYQLKGEFLSGYISNESYFRTINQLENEQLNFLYLTPEKLIKSDHLQRVLLNLYKNNKLTRFVIDEAHCISQMGHDFRKEYLKLSILRDKYPLTPIMALTATATKYVKKDIILYLKMKEYIIVQQSFDRTNLFFQVVDKKDNFNENCQLIHEWILDHKYKNETGIIFCLTRSDTIEISQRLSKYGYKIDFYHGELTHENRTIIQNKWTNDEIKIIVATNAFGMGIDKPNVRFVIHFSIPKSLEEYYQESGRAGRDGCLSHCLLLYNSTDYNHAFRIICHSEDGKVKCSKEIEREKILLDKMDEYAREKEQCRHFKILKYFDEKIGNNECNEMCDNCKKKGKTCGNSHKIDMTEHAKHIASIINKIYQKRKTSPYATDCYIIKVFTGSKSKDIVNSGDSNFEEAGKGKLIKKYKKTMEHILSKLSNSNIIEKKCIYMKHGVISYWTPGEKMENFLNSNKIKILLDQVE